MTVSYPIVPLGEGTVLDPDWISDVTEAVNDHQDRLTAIEALSTLFAYKTADESVSSSTTAQNDDHLAATVAANARYIIDMWVVVFSSSETPDFQVNFTQPSLATVGYSSNGLAFSTTGTVVGSVQMQALINQTSPTNRQTTGVVADNTVVRISGLLTTSSTAGTLQFQWSQQTSNAAAVIVRAGSWMRLQRIS